MLPRFLHSGPVYKFIRSGIGSMFSTENTGIELRVQHVDQRRGLSDSRAHQVLDGVRPGFFRTAKQLQSH
jgi:hypothetical protein